jgi:primosomal protein N'
MLAEVYPVMRMPRKFGVFDYEIPEGMNLRRGSIVHVPFRHGETVGVVARVKDGGGKGIRLKRVASIVSPPTAFSDAELDAYEDVAFDAAQSVSSVLHAAIPKMRQREAGRASSPSPTAMPLTIPAREAPSIALAATQFAQRQTASVIMPDLRRATAFVAAFQHEHPNEPIMVLLPNVRDARLVASRLGDRRLIVATGEESARDRAIAWKAWRASSDAMLVGTRTAALWSHPKLGAVFLLRSGHPNHKQSDRNPRIDARAVAETFGSRLHARVARVDVSPRTEDLLSADVQDPLGPRTRPQTAVADMAVERLSAAHPRIGPSAVLRIAETLQAGRRVLCAYNLKGVSRRVQCADCGRRFPCPACGGVFASYDLTVRCHRCGRVDPMPVACPACGGKRLSARGYGNRAVAAALQKMFPEATVGCVEKGSDAVAADGSDILVVTRHYYENVFDPFQPPNVGLVVDLDADLPLYEPTSGAVERALLSAEEWRGVANACRADVLLQTEAADLFRSLMTEPERMLSEDLEHRRVYGQPPFCRIMTVRYKSSEPHERAAALRSLSDAIRREVPESNIIESEEGIRLSVPHDRAAVILRLFSSTSDRYIIDTRPAGH